MRGRIPESVIADIRDRTDIVQVIGRYVELKRSGGNHKGLCPFHDEKTPSFNVNADKQFFHCFGCQESGDVIGFLMKLEGRTFMEVVEELAQRAGVEIQHESPAEAQRAAARRSERQRMLDLNAKVLGFYRALLSRSEGSEARDYLAQRGISDEIAERFQLGFAPDGAQRLVRKLESAGIPLEEGVRAGVIARRRNGGYYDRFWNRLIFPLVGAGGEVLGFGGRTLSQESDVPKYVNTPETSLYRKGEALYGIDAAAAAMRRTDTCLLVEGNFDVLQMHQYGFDNTIAPMGTALTERQVRLVRRFASRIVAIFDGDSAGRKAARRAAPTMVEGGVEAKIVRLPLGKDPDDLLADQGAEEMTRLIEHATPVVDYLLSELQDEMEDSVPGRARVLQAIAPVVANLENPVIKDLYVDRLALTLHIEREVVRRATASGGSEHAKRLVAEADAEAARQQGRPVPREPLPPHEVDPIAILLEHPHLFPRAEEANLRSLLTNDGLRATYSAAMELQRESGTVDVPQLLRGHTTDPRVKDELARRSMSGEYKTDGDPRRLLDDCIHTLQELREDERMASLRASIASAEAAGEQTQNQLRELNELIKKKRQRIHETR
ncbi:MAG: DNA primase [Myxococcales bacterium]|nr:DNA primase [Myxococcales bacterium]